MPLQWDVLASGNPVYSVAQIATGMDPGSCISIIQPFEPKDNKMLILQESSIDLLGGIILYSPTDLPDVISAVNGGDMTKIPILPSGFVVSDNGRANKVTAGPSTSSNTGGSLLTVAFQILVGCSTLTKQLKMESVAMVHTLISSTVQKIKACLDYHD